MVAVEAYGAMDNVPVIRLEIMADHVEIEADQALIQKGESEKSEGADHGREG
jgi:hypothetical protein